MKQLGGDQQSQLFTPKAIKELFQVKYCTLHVIYYSLDLLASDVSVLLMRCFIKQF